MGQIIAGYWKFVGLQKEAVEAVATDLANGHDGERFKRILVKGAGDNSWQIVFEYLPPDNSCRAFNKFMHKKNQEFVKRFGTREHGGKTYPKNVSGWSISSNVSIIK